MKTLTEKRREAKQKLVEQRGEHCAICNQKYHQSQFDFHHVLPETKQFDVNTRTISSKSWQRILQESNKCIMICSNCHRLLHQRNKLNENTHS